MFCCHIVSEYFSNLTVNLVEVGQRGQKNNKNIHFKKGNSAANTCFITIRIIFISCLH